jgi:hypothetical protein
VVICRIVIDRANRNTVICRINSINTAGNTSTGGERQNNTYFSNHEYAFVVKKHPAGPAAQPREFDLEGGNNQSQQFETEDEYDTLKHTVDKGEEQIENNVYDSSLGVCDPSGCVFSGVVTNCIFWKTSIGRIAIVLFLYIIRCVVICRIVIDRANLNTVICWINSITRP